MLASGSLLLVSVLGGSGRTGSEVGLCLAHASGLLSGFHPQCWPAAALLRLDSLAMVLPRGAGRGPVRLVPGRLLGSQEMWSEI